MSSCGRRWLCRLLALLALVRRPLGLLPVGVDGAVGGALLVHPALRLVAAVVLLVLAHASSFVGSEPPFARSKARLPFPRGSARRLLGPGDREPARVRHR